jgi:hypothetical protein
MAGLRRKGSINRWNERMGVDQGCLRGKVQPLRNMPTASRRRSTNALTVFTASTVQQTPVGVQSVVQSQMEKMVCKGDPLSLWASVALWHFLDHLAA